MMSSLSGALAVAIVGAGYLLAFPSWGPLVALSLMVLHSWAFP